MIRCLGHLGILQLTFESAPERIGCDPRHFSPPSFACRLVKGGLDMIADQNQKSDYFRFEIIVRIKAQHGCKVVLRLVGRIIGILILAFKIMDYMKSGIF